MAWIEGSPAVIGGQSMNKDISSVEVLKAGEWIEVSPINIPRDSHVSVTIPQGVWTMGGLLNKKRLNSIEKYENKAWSVINLVLPMPWSDIGVCSLENNLLLFGGKTPNNIITDMVIYINTETLSITRLTPLEIPVLFHITPFGRVRTYIMYWKRYYEKSSPYNILN